MNRIPASEISHAIVRRPFTSLGKKFVNGDEITRDFLVGMPRANLDAMSDSRQIEIFRLASRPSSGKSATAIDGLEVGLHLRAAGIGVYDVIKGVVVASNLTKEAAQALIDSKLAPVKAEAATDATPAKAKKPRKAKKKTKRAKSARSAKPKSEPKIQQPPAQAAAQEENGPIE